MICPGCGCVFCPAPEDNAGIPQQVYCEQAGCGQQEARKRSRIRARLRNREARRVAEAEAARFEKRRAACERKIAYGSQRQADRAIPAMRLKGYPVDHSYDCVVCPWWHHTSRPDRAIERYVERAEVAVQLRAAG